MFLALLFPFFDGSFAIIETVISQVAILELFVKQGQEDANQQHKMEYHV